MMLAAIPWFDMSSNQEPGIIFFLSMVFMFMYFPLGIIFDIYAVIASVNSYKGKMFKYAIIGRIIQKKMFKEDSLKSTSYIMPEAILSCRASRFEMYSSISKFSSIFNVLAILL